MNSGHQTLNNSEVVVDDLGKRSETVGCARCVGDNLHLWLVLLEVDSADEHGGIGGRSRDDDVLGTSLDVSICLLSGGEDSGGLDNSKDIVLSPRNGRWVSLCVASNLVSIDDQLSTGSLDITLESSVGGVVLEHVDHVFKIDEGIVDGNNLDILLEESISEDTGGCQ